MKKRQQNKIIRDVDKIKKHLALPQKTNIVETVLTPSGKSNPYLQNMVDTLPLASYVTDAEGRVTHFNKHATLFAGRVPKLGELWCITWKLFYLDGKRMPHDQCPMAVALQGGEILDRMEAIVERPDGSRGTFRPQITLLKNKSGKIIGAINIIIDTTQRNKTLSKLSESEIRYRRLFETAHDGILILDPESGKITDVNPYLIAILGYSKEEFLHKKVWEVGAFKNMKAFKDAFNILLKDGYLRFEDLPLETKDGRLVDVEFVCNAYIAGGNLVIQCNIRDMTERKRIDEIKATTRLLEEEKLKVRSIADATHEFRTPLAVIKGNVDLALHKGKNKKPAEVAFRAINYEIKHLTSILSDLSIITSRSWDSKTNINYKRTTLNSFITTAVRRCKTLSLNNNISITLKNIPSVTIWGDRLYLEKMMVNLINNAIIYGRENGHIIIDAKQSKQSITINVADDGIGIPKEDLPHIFERFYRVDKFHRTEVANIGLGLSIVKWVVETHGGDVKVKSVLGKGSIFSVTLQTKNGGGGVKTSK